MVIQNEHNIIPDNSIELSQGRVIYSGSSPDPNNAAGNAGAWNNAQNQNYQNGGYGQNNAGYGNGDYNKGYDTGYDRGYWQGYDKSYNSGYEEGYRKAMEEAERNAANFQNNQYNGNYQNGGPNYNGYNGNYQNGSYNGGYQNAGPNNGYNGAYQQYNGYPNDGYQQYNGYQQNQNFQNSAYQQGAYNRVNYDVVNRAMNNVPDNYYARPIKNKVLYGVLGIALGSVGAHKFYEGKTFQGILSCIFVATGIPAIVGLVEGIIALTQSNEEFEDKHRVRLK